MFPYICCEHAIVSSKAVYGLTNLITSKIIIKENILTGGDCKRDEIHIDFDKHINTFEKKKQKLHIMAPNVSRTWRAP